MNTSPVPDSQGAERPVTALQAAGVILAGAILIAILTPLAQFLTIGALNSAMETSAPSAMAVGLVVSLVVVFLVVRWLLRLRLPKVHLVILYIMLTIAVPLMNLGLVRPLYLSLASVYFEYIYMGTSTYRTAYNARTPEWFPVVPDRAGLAWNQADRLIRLLQDPAAEQAAGLAMREIARAVSSAAASDAFLPSVAELTPRIARLRWDHVDALQRMPGAGPATERLGIAAALAERREASRRESAAALAVLDPLLEPYDEFTASLLAENRAAQDFSSAERLRKEYEGMPPGAKSELDAKVARLANDLPLIREHIGKLAESDRIELRRRVEKRTASALAALDESGLQAVRGSFVFRLNRAERMTLMTQDGSGDTPNNNLRAFRFGLGAELAIRRQMAEQGFWENVRMAWNAIPWSLWSGPVIRWSLVVAAVFLFFFCLAEWFRRKWVDRENLAFPLVEVADHIIRHDRVLESASDIQSPPARSGWFSPLFLAGCAVGFAVLSLEALGHYQITGQPFLFGFDVSNEIFSTGVLKGMGQVVLVLSPLVIGLLFLVNLEISFSIWVLFVLYKLVFWLLGNSADLRDSLWTGYGGGRDFPFQMEQMLGASICFSAILIGKSFAGRRGPEAPGVAPFVPPKAALCGVVLLPLAIGALLWSAGVSHLPLLLLVGVVLLAQTVASARARAETGLPAQHVTYDITRLPLIFGMTGATGAKCYSLFINLNFLSVGLLLRTFPQHLENLELARRFRLSYRVVAAGTLAAFAAALATGLVSFLVFSYLFGEKFQGVSVFPGYFSDQNALGVAHYPLWVSHFTGEEGLSKFTQIHGIRMVFLAVGAGVFGLLAFLRGRFLKFPLHPLGYFLLLISIWFPFISPYARGAQGLPGQEASVLWGSALVAWGVKSLIIKYGGMNVYKVAKTFFIGLVVGSLFCIFFWNVLDLGASLAAGSSTQPPAVFKPFLERPPYSPTVY